MQVYENFLFKSTYDIFGNLEFISKCWIGPNTIFGKSWIWKYKIGQISNFLNFKYLGVLYNTWIWILKLNFLFSNKFYVAKYYLNSFELGYLKRENKSRAHISLTWAHVGLG